MPDSFPLSSAYNEFLIGLKEKIRSAQVRAALSVNQEMILLYWKIGNELLERQKKEKWGTKVLERLSKDLKQEFPGMQGFSQTNLKYMRLFAGAYSEELIRQCSVDQLPWRHNIALLLKLKNTEERLWYAEQALENGWSHDVLVLQIESGLFQRSGGAVSNFDRTLPAPQSDLVQQLVKDPYCLDFLGPTGKKLQERDLENALVRHIREFLLELGVGFAFVGSQYPLIVRDKEYRIDLLFYHFRLRCFVVIDLKMGEFEPEYAGKMNFYVSAVDDLMRHPDDKPTIGIILCKAKERTVVEYALRNLSTPIAVSSHLLPEQLQESLPTAEQLEMEMEAAVAELEQQTEEKL